jgi:signal transduction histidine kinase
MLRIEVLDSGAGIEPAHRERVFDRGWSTKTDGDRHGLGLALARQAVHRNGGTIDVLSQPAGTTFQVRLPISADDRTPPGGPADGTGEGEAVAPLERPISAGAGAER